MRITEEEKQLTRFSIDEALRFGADQARAFLSKSISDEYSVLDGELDRVSHTADRSIYMYLFVDGRYGTYSTNRLDKDSLSAFIAKCVSATRLLNEDRDYSLPDKERCAVQTGDGTEMGLFDENYFEMTSERRLELAMKSHLKTSQRKGKGWKVVSCESSYSDCLVDTILMDSNGLELRNTQTAFTVSCDVTAEDAKGNKFNSYWWEGGSIFAELKDMEKCARKALERTLAQMNPAKARGGRHKMVVDTNVASRLISPIINSLYADSIQQKGSFLCDSLGKKLFPEFLHLRDYTQIKGMGGSRLFDNEGVATQDRDLICEGKVCNYLTTTYYAKKMGLEPTIGSVSIPTVLPCSAPGFKLPEGENWDVAALAKSVRNGILVTGFNGGNCNASTGDFSYGVEGFKIRDGKIAEPVKELLITGNMIELWNNLLAAGNDARKCTRWQIPSLAFSDVSFSA